MKVSDKQKVLVEFLVGKNRRVALPCLALTSEESIRKGLMNVKKMSRNVGVLFVFEKNDLHTFWMKNTGISLDIVFISEQGIVNQIEKGKTFDLSPMGGLIPSRYVVETISGFCERNGILRGMRVKVSPLLHEQNIHFRSFQAWIDTQGEIISGFDMHEDFAKSFFIKKGERVDPLDEDDYYSKKLIELGWVRQSECTFEVARLTKTAAWNIFDAAKEHNCGSVVVDELSRSNCQSYSSANEFIEEVENVA